MRKITYIISIILFTFIAGHQTLAQDTSSTLDREDFPPVRVAEIASGCLVTVESVGLPYAGFSTLNPFQRTISEIGGTGFIIRSDGYIIASPRVVRDSEILTVIHDGIEYDATVELIDEYYDLALLRIDATGLPAPKLGNSDLVLRGDPIVVMGAPAGLERTMTYGFITNIRDFRISGPRGYDGMLVLDGFVVDAATHTGMETGPIFNSNGELVAVLSRKGVGRGGAIENISYCIPVNLLAHLSDQMIDAGKVCHPWLGIFPYIYYTRSLALYMGIPINEIDPETAEAYDVVGILVEMVADTSPAAEAGIVRGDLILRADDVLLRTIKDLEEIILNKQCDETLTLTIIRNFDIKYIDINIGNKQEDYGNIYFAYGRVSI